MFIFSDDFGEHGVEVVAVEGDRIGVYFDGSDDMSVVPSYWLAEMLGNRLTESQARSKATRQGTPATTHGGESSSGQSETPAAAVETPADETVAPVAENEMRPVQNPVAESAQSDVSPKEEVAAGTETVTQPVGEAVQAEVPLAEDASDEAHGDGEVPVSEAAVSMPMREVGTGKSRVTEPDWLAVSSERGHDWLYNESGLSRADADEIVANNIDAARKAVEKAGKRKPKKTTNPFVRQADNAAIEEERELAQRTLAYWEAVQSRASSLRAQAEAQRRAAEAEAQRAAHEQAVAEEQRYQAAQQAKMAEERERASVAEQAVASVGSGEGSAGAERSGGSETPVERESDLAQTEVTAPLSEEVDEFDKPFVISSRGTTTFGEVGAESGLTAAPIKLSLGENIKDENGANHGYGWLHIEAGHGDQIRAAGFSSVEEFVETVARNYDTIREGSIIADNQTYLLEISDEHNNTLFIQLSRDGSYWNVNSAGIFKKKYSRRKPEVFTRPALEPDTNTDTSGVDSGRSEGVTTPAGNSPQTSAGKGSENSESGKEKTEKVAESKASTVIAEAEQEVKRTAAHFAEETPEEAAVFDRRVPEMDDAELLAYMQEDGNGDMNKAHHPSVYDEYDDRHGDEQVQSYDDTLVRLNESGTTREQAEEMLANIQKDVSRLATDERAMLLGQEDALQEYIAGQDNSGGVQGKSGEVREQRGEAAERSDEFDRAVLNEFVELMRSNGIDVVTDVAEIERVYRAWERVQSIGAEMRKRKSAKETALPEGETSFKGTAISSTDGAKVLQNLDMLAKKSENLTPAGVRTFLGDVAEVIGATKYGSNSRYATFETASGDVVTIRLADHNAHVSGFDNEGRDNGISIVISRKPNNGVLNDGDAHIVEFFYRDKDLRKAEGSPYAAIVRSIEQALYSGEYRDTTGLAQREEVNGGEVMREMRVWHGSDAKIVDHIQFMRTERGEVLGFTMGGRIYVDPRVASAETPVHEYFHLWAEALEKANPRAWAELKEALFADEGLKPLIDEVKAAYPELAENELAHEVFAHYGGRRGRERMREMRERMLSDAGHDVLRKAGIIAMFERMRELLSRYWSLARDLFAGKNVSLRDKSVEEIADMTLGDLLGGFNPVVGVSAPFYSNAERAVDGVKQDKAKAEQWKAMLTKGGGIKAGEDKWMGLSVWLDERKGETLTKGEVLEFVRANGIRMEEVNYGDAIFSNNSIRNLEGDIKRGIANGESIEDVLSAWDNAFGDTKLEEYRAGRFEISEDGTLTSNEETRFPVNSTRLNYTTEGLANKREIAFVLPEVEPYQEYDEVHFGPENGGKAVMWVRFGEAKDKDGKRVLVIDEIQSNRHQDAREKGYVEENLKAIRNRYEQAEKAYEQALTEELALNERAKSLHGGTLEGLTEEEWDVLRDAYRRTLEAREERATAHVDYVNASRGEVSGVPAAPFEKNWHEVAMKRMLRLAAEEGFDKVAWTTGMQQAERYDLSKQVSGIEVRRDSLDPLTGERQPQQYNVYTYDRNGNMVSAASGEMSPERIVEVFGKDLGERMLAVPEGGKETIEGDGLRIGGEGMKGFYDEILPRFIDKYGKKWGVKTGEVQLSTPGNEVMHSVDVTGAMKRSVLEQGQPLFQREPAGNGERVKGNDIAIDDRVAQREYLLSDNYVASLTGDEFAKSDEPLTERVAQFYAENYGGEVEREGVGVVVLDKRGVKDSISHGVGRNKAAAFAAVPDIIRDGVLVDQKKNWKNRNYDSYTIAAPVEIAGEGFVGVAIVTRGHGTNINKFYLHEVVLQKNLHDESIKTDTKADSHRGDVAKVLREIVTAKENSGNNSETIVNGGEEPVVGEPGEADIRYRDGGASGLLREDAAALAAARERVLELAERLGLDVVIVDDMSADERRRLTERQRRARGMYDMGSGRVYVNLGNHRTAEDALLTALHEGVAHHGLRALFGERFDAMLEQVYRESSPEVRAAIDEKLSAIREEKRRQKGAALTSVEERASLLEAVDETLADVAEDMGRNDEFSRPWYRQLWESVKQALRDVARAVGLRREMSDGELRYMLWSSYHNLEREAASKGRTIAQAQDIAARERYGVAQRDEQWRTEGVRYIDEMTDDEISEDLRDVKVRHGLKSRSVLAVINTEQDLESLRGKIEDEVFNKIVEKFHDDNVFGCSQAQSGVIYIFPRKQETMEEVEGTWWHESTHIAWSDIEMADKEECGRAALEYLKKYDAYHYDMMLRGNYPDSKLAEEATCRLVQHIIGKYGTEAFLSAKMGGSNEKVAKLAAVLQYYFNNGQEKTNDYLRGLRADNSRGIREGEGSREGQQSSRLGRSGTNSGAVRATFESDDRRGIGDRGLSPIGEDIRYRDGEGGGRTPVTAGLVVDDRVREGDVVNGLNYDADGNVSASWQGVVRRVFDNGGIELDGGVQYSRRMVDVYFGRSEQFTRGAYSAIASVTRGDKTVVSQSVYDIYAAAERSPVGTADIAEPESPEDAAAATREEREELVDALSSWPVRGYSEALVDALAREASDHRENVEARRSALHEISKELRSWRERAARVQREFDRATVDRLVSLARAMLTANALNGLTRGEVKRLLSVINRSVGAKDLTEAVNTVADIMTKHLLRELEGTFKQLINTKDKKVDQHGVQVQGALDVKGQRMLNAMRESMEVVAASGGKRMDENGELTEWGEYIGSIQDRIGSSDSVVASNASLEFQGALLAEQWWEMIEESRGTERRLKRELREAQERIYDFRYDEQGRLVGKKLKPEFRDAGISEENKLIKRSVRDFEAAVREQLRESRMDRVDGYRQLLRGLGGELSESIRRAEEFRERGRERFDRGCEYRSRRVSAD